MLKKGWNELLPCSVRMALFKRVHPNRSIEAEVRCNSRYSFMWGNALNPNVTLGHGQPANNVITVKSWQVHLGRFEEKWFGLVVGKR